jgi:histidine ammonia-lyase
MSARIDYDDVARRRGARQRRRALHGHGQPGAVREPRPLRDFLFQQKPHRGVVRSAGAIRDYLGQTTQECDDGAACPRDGYRQLSRPLQDRYSIRCAPHVIGALRDTVTWAEEMLTVEINSSNDNPLFDDKTGTVLNGGNFYGSHVGQAMDSLKIAVASVGDLLERQLELVVDEKFNNGLTPNLIRCARRPTCGAWSV